MLGRVRACICCRVYAERQQLNERLFSLLQPPPPEQPEYADVLREVLAAFTLNFRVLGRNLLLQPAVCLTCSGGQRPDNSWQNCAWWGA